MDYREWGHGSRDPLDGVARRSGWDDEEYDVPRQGNGRAADWDRDHGESWQTGTGWVTVQPRGQPPESDGYLTDPRYGVGDPEDWYRLWPGPPAPPVPPPPAPPTPPRASAPWEPRPRPGQRRSAEVTRRQAGPQRPRPRRPRMDDDDLVEPERGYLWTVVTTVIWYAVPVVLYILWALTLGGTPEPNCLDPAGNPCGAPRAEALATLGHTVPRLSTAVALSLVVAIVMRWANTTWRAATIGFAASVVGAGIATAIFTLIGGSPPA